MTTKFWMIVLDDGPEYISRTAQPRKKYFDYNEAKNELDRLATEIPEVNYVLLEAVEQTTKTDAEI